LAYVRFFRHYFHSAYLLMAAGEVLLFLSAAYLGYFVRNAELPPLVAFLPQAAAFAAIVSSAMVAMGVYGAYVREGFTGMSLRTAVGVFLLGAAGTGLLSLVFPELALGRGELLFAALSAYLLAGLFRYLVFALAPDNIFKKRVVILGTGQRALKIASRMRRRSDQRAFTLVGFLDREGREHNPVADFGAQILITELTLPEFCEIYAVDEIVVAMDERRRNQDASGGLPLEELLECRLTGINICDVQQFIEREAQKIDVDLLRASWIVFADGFFMGPGRAFVKRSFDILASLLLLIPAIPVMAVTAVLIKLQNPRLPVLYRQLRVGAGGVPFTLYKFRSMTVLAGDDESAWTGPRDPRVTLVGRFIRKTRIDELPQIFNVLRNDMSFVGPRPERPAIVTKLNEQVPFYEQRHRIKPGITGWAQLCYPYGASVADAKEKLQYDLYYLKNHSLLLDLIILLQTVEVVLVGEGAR